jgi:hypothetical protein
MTVTMDTIEAYFQQYGWSYKQMDDTHIVTGFDSEVTDVFTIYVTLAPNWVYFAIVPYIQAPTDPRCEQKLYKHLLRLCQEINLVKFAADADGDIVLAVELPRESLDYSEFADALNALSYYSDQNYAAIQSLATDPDALSGFEAERGLDWQG